MVKHIINVDIVLRQCPDRKKVSLLEPTFHLTSNPLYEVNAESEDNISTREITSFFKEIGCVHTRRRTNCLDEQSSDDLFI